MRTKTMATQDTIKHILDIGMLLQDNTVSKGHRKQLASIVRNMGKSLTLAEIQGQDLVKTLALADIILLSNTLLEQITELLRASVSEEYVSKIANYILAEVQEDIIASADTEYNDVDIKLAIGRALTNALIIQG